MSRGNIKYDRREEKKKRKWNGEGFKGEILKKEAED